MATIILTERDQVDDAVEVSIRECLSLEVPRSFFLYAGAGSGKTHTLVETAKFLLKKYRRRLLYRSQRIAIITYTNAACDEIMRRLEFDPLIDVSTIHAFAWRMIKGFDADMREWLRNALAGDIQKLEDQLGKSRGENKTTITRRAERDRKIRRLEHLDQIVQFSYSPTGRNENRDSLNHAEVVQMAATFLADGTLRDVLVDMYPILFIDESQDTNGNLMDALLEVQKALPERFCIGLFGDTMQRIYFDGKERLDESIPEDWARPAKILNRRCPKRVVSLINKIRGVVDDQVQHPLENKAEGTVRLFLTNQKEQPSFEVEEAAAGLMAEATGEPLWREGQLSRKTLILEHRMAARRMGFESIFDALIAVDHLRTSLLDGTLPVVRFLGEDILPIVDAGLSGDSFALIEAVRARSPLIESSQLASSGDQLALIRNAGEGANSLTNLFWDREPNLGEVVSNLVESRLLAVPPLLEAACAAGNADEEPPEGADRNQLELHAYRKILGASFSEVRKFSEYANGYSAFDTHQGVKGLEFPRVMVIISDLEAAGFLFSYDKLFGAIAPSATDQKNEREGKDTSISRTRRLFYVACSRAVESLAIVMYSPDPAAVRSWVLDHSWFAEDEVVLL